mmetsp:Transcript_78238/g.253965  ORF Transcript_78238/g.253965 Transcript_78238/m.253965 type:complete len:698 (-) Transcript_78238:143-2236(-)
MATAGEQMQEENLNLKQQLMELQRQRQQEKEAYEQKLASEKEAGQQHFETAQQHHDELQALKGNMVKLTKQLDEEVTKRDQVQATAASLERHVAEIASGHAPASSGTSPGGSRPRARTEDEDSREKGAQVSTKLMRVVDQWMRQHDLQQALLRGAHINDQSFATLAQAFVDCPSLQTLDLSENLLTMDSCSDLCHIVTAAPNLSFLSLAENSFTLRSIGYFMTAVMERQSAKKLMPLDLLDLSGNEGLLAAAAAPTPPSLLQAVKASLGHMVLPPQGVELTAQVMLALWRFLHDTSHPQVANTSPDEISFQVMDKMTLRKMEAALSTIMLLGVEPGKEGVQRPVTANLALFSHMEQFAPSYTGAGADASLSPLAGRGGADDAAPGWGSGLPQRPTGALPEVCPPRRSSSSSRLLPGGSPVKSPLHSIKDPFADLKSAFESPKDKLKTFNLKQIVTRNGTVLMNMLERLLETTDVDAHDVETEQTLLEYACSTSNIGLAKLCYRRGAKLAGKTRKGDTPFNIVTKNKRYDMMEFLHTYGVKVNSCDKDGKTGLHCAAHNNDLDGICRLVEWGADVNIRDSGKRTPIHTAAAAGNMQATMLLLEVGADMNAKDEKLYTAAAHANFNSHFALFDRLTALGGRRHGQIKTEQMKAVSTTKMGELVVSAGMLKSSSLGRIGKITVGGLPGPIQPTLTLETKK